MKMTMKKFYKILYISLMLTITLTLFAFAESNKSLQLTDLASIGTGLSVLGKKIGLALGMGLAVLGGGIGQGLTGAKAMESVGRNPESYSKIMVLMLIALAFIEALVLYMLVLAFMKY